MEDEQKKEGQGNIEKHIEEEQAEDTIEVEGVEEDTDIRSKRVEEEKTGQDYRAENPPANMFASFLTYAGTAAGAAADALAKRGKDAVKSGSKIVLKKAASLAAEKAGSASRSAYDSAARRLNEVKIEKGSSDLERKLAAVGMVVGAMF